MNRILLALGALGMFIAATLTLSHANVGIIPCGAANGCAALANRPESKWGGVPVSIFGLALYGALFALASARAFWPKGSGWTVKAGLALSGIGFLTSVALVVQLTTVLKLQCYWCFGSAVTMTLTFIAYLLLLRAAPKVEDDVMIDAGLVAFGLLAALAIPPNIITPADPINGLMPGVEAQQIRYEDLVPDASYVRGNPNARVMLVEIADFYCPACRRSKELLDQLKAKYGDRLAVAYRSLPLYNLEGHENSIQAALAAEWAREQGKYWDFVDLMFAAEGNEARTPEAVADLLDAIGLDGERWLREHTQPNTPMFNALDQGMKAFNASRIQSTPTFVLFLDKGSPVALAANGIAEALESPTFAAALGEGTTQP